MIKMMIAARRKPGMSLADYRDYVRVQHGKLAFDQPNGVLRYVQNHVFDGAFGAVTDSSYGALFGRDSVVELYFAGLPEFGSSMAHPYTHQVIIPDGARFAEVSTNMVLIAREEALHVPRMGMLSNAGIKVLHYLQKPADLSLDDFSARWNAAMQTIIESNHTFSTALRRCTLSHSLPPPPGKPGAAPPGGFGGAELPSFHGVASLWFDEEAGSTGLRGYLHDLTALGGGEGGFFNPSAGFYVCARELTVFEISQTVSASMVGPA